MVEKVVKNNFFHDLGLQNGLSRGKSWPGQLFPLFPRISEEVFGIIKMVEKVVKNNFFHHFREKNFLRNSWKSQKKFSKTTFSTTQAVLGAQIVAKVVFDNFFHFFHEFPRKSLES